MAGWRFYLQSLPGGEWIDKDLPLTGARVIESVNAPASISGSLPLGFGQLVNADGSLVIREWGCLIVAEREGRSPIVGIVDGVSTEGNRLNVDAGGFSMYPTGTPWLGADFAGIQVDPLDMVRKIWDHLQSYPDGDLGVVVDPLKSPVRVGTKEVTSEFTTGAGEDVSIVSGPFRLAWWNTDDLGKVFSDLAKETPFQYRERSAWDGENLTHRLELGYPRIGARRENLRFEIGVNVTAIPPADEGDYASEVLLFGAGEGSKKRRGTITAQTGRLRRVHVATDKSITSNTAATKAARPMMDRLKGAYGIESLEVVDHESAPYGTFGPGDDIRVQGDAGWIQLDMWVRVQDLTVDCDTGKITLKVEAL